MMTIFTKIIKGEIPSYKIAENQHAYAFLDIRPLKEGHVLVVPKKEVDYIFDLDDETWTALHLFAKQIGVAIKKVIPCQRVGIAVIGLEVPHAHIHLIPIDSEKDLSFANKRLSLSEEEFKNIAQKIREAL
ncbi:MAG: HIT family protein [Bernardetiaceae bacterium]|nr:HIT family protein [Bernardetiaceae bacterium]